MLPRRLRSDAAKIKLKSLDELLCKRVSVDIVKLPNAEERLKNRLRQRPTLYKKYGPSVKMTYFTPRKNIAIKKRNSSIKKSTSSVVKHKTSKLKDISSLLKAENQPFVKLHRIDNVFNKVAQSLARSSAQGDQRNKAEGVKSEVPMEVNVEIVQEEPKEVSMEASKKVRRESVNVSVETQTIDDPIVQEEPKEVPMEASKKVRKESVNVSVETQTIDDLMVDDVKESRIEFVSDADSDSDESDIIFRRSTRYDDSDNDESCGKPKPKRMRINSYTSDEADTSTETVVLEPSNSSEEDLDKSIKTDIEEEEQVNEESQVNVDSSNSLVPESDDSRDTVLLGIKEEEELIIFDEISSPAEVINIRDICPKDLRVDLLRFDGLKQFDKKYSAMEVEKAIEDYTNPSSLSDTTEAKLEDEEGEKYVVLSTSPRTSSLQFYELLMSGTRPSPERTPEKCSTEGTPGSSRKTSPEKTPERPRTPPTEKTPEKSFFIAANYSPTPTTGDFLQNARMKMFHDCSKRIHMCAPNGGYTGSVVDLLKPHSPAAVMACFKSPSSKKSRRRRKKKLATTHVPDESDEATEAEDSRAGSPSPAADGQQANSQRCARQPEPDSPEKKHSDESLEIPEEPPLVIETPEEPAETPESKDKPEPEAEGKDAKSKAKGSRRARSPRKKKTEKRKKNESEKPVNDGGACSVCSRVFPDRQNLTAHFFLHGEKECQSAYQQQLIKDTNMQLPKDKSQKKSKDLCSLKITEPRTITEKELNEAMTAESDKMETNERRSSCENVEDRTTPQTSASAPAETGLLDLRVPAKESDRPETSGDSSEAPTETETRGGSDKSEEAPATEPQKPETDTKTKKRITLCECHTNLEPDRPDLGIEIVLLCQVCRTLFRSPKCFKNHYDKPQYSGCKLAERSQSPYLFCVSCAKVFNSADNLRHHLETHYSKLACATDYRCNICKVMFYGVGSLFYTHWASHSRNPYWVGDEQSFPDESLVRLPSFNNLLIDGYITVAEYQCTKCKAVFATGGELKAHVEYCSKLINRRLQILCNLCDVTYTDKCEFYKHVRNTHNLCGDPQLRVNGSTITCNVCNEDTMNLTDFDNHWLKHLMTHTTFTCKYCGVEFEDNLEKFLAHGRLHTIGGDVCCSVHYTNMDHICERCYIGFSSLAEFREHMSVHGEEEPIGNNRSNVSDKENFLEPGSLDAQEESNGKMDGERSLENGSGINGDTEELPQTLDHELIIDLTKEEPEEEQQRAPAPEAPPENEGTRMSGNESASVENESQWKPRKGFLRVKTLQELTGTPFNCKTCGCSFETAAELSSHEKLHEKPETNGSSSSTRGNVRLDNVIGVVTQNKDHEPIRNAFKLRLLVNDVGVCKEVPLRMDQLKVSQQPQEKIQLQQAQEKIEFQQPLEKIEFQQAQEKKQSQQAQEKKQSQQSEQFQQPKQSQQSEQFQEPRQPKQSQQSQELRQSQEPRQPQQSQERQQPQQPKQSQQSQELRQSQERQQPQQPNTNFPLNQQTVASARVDQPQNTNASSLSQQQDSSSASPIGYHRNLPYTNLIRKSKAIPRSAILKKDGTVYKFRPVITSQPPSLTPIQMPSLTPIQTPSRTTIQTPSLTPIQTPSLTPNRTAGQPATRTLAQPAKTVARPPSHQPNDPASYQLNEQPSHQPIEPASRQPAQPKTRPPSRVQTEPKPQPAIRQPTHPTTQPPSYPGAQPQTQPASYPGTQPQTQPASQQQPVATDNEHLLISFFFVIDSNNPQAKFKCKFCGFRSSSQFECVKHSDPGSEAPCKVKYMQIQPQGQGNVAGSYNKPVPQPSPSPGQNTSFVTSYTLGNSSGGSMAIVINQPAATGMQEVPTFGILQASLQPQTETQAQADAQPQIYQQQQPQIYQPQPQIYQPQVYQQEPQLYEQQPQFYQQEQPQMYEQPALYENPAPLYHPNPMAVVGTPYLQQSQNVVIRSNNVRQVRRDQVPNGEAVTTCEVRLRPTRFFCSHCSKRSQTFSSEILLQEHVRAKHNFVCTVCRERFYRRDELVVHKVKHGKAKENVVSQL